MTVGPQPPPPIASKKPPTRPSGAAYQTLASSLVTRHAEGEKKSAIDVLVEQVRQPGSSRGCNFGRMDRRTRLRGRHAKRQQGCRRDKAKRHPERSVHELCGKPIPIGVKNSNVMEPAHEHGLPDAPAEPWLDCAVAHGELPMCPVQRFDSRNS